MAGLIQKEMGGSVNDEANEQESAGGIGPNGLPQGGLMGDEQPEANAPKETDPIFQQAMSFAYDALYSKEAAKDVANQLEASSNVADAMADIAYNITSIIDEKTDGQVPDELLVPLAMNVLEEVGEIAEAAGIEPTPEDIATAFKTMILRYLGEQGIDTTQLQQAMDQVDPSEFRKVAETA
jgi:hypothetical protein